MTHPACTLACFSVVALGFAGGSMTRAQAAPQQDQEPTYRLSTRTRIVVEDVTVTDAKGKAVTGLPESAFHLTDDTHAQPLVSFDENSQTSTQPAEAATPGRFSNAALYRNQGVVTVMLIDPIGMELGDQMYLRLQMLQYIKELPAGAQVVVFRSTSQGTPVLLQSLTDDHALLTAAVNHAVPSMSRPVSRVYANAIDELRNMAEYLRPVPGRKALLWFAGKFPLYRQPTYGVATAQIDQSQEEQYTRAAFRALEQARIAVYPIDVRGVVIANIGYNPAGDVTQMANDPSLGPKASTGEAQQLGGSYNAMDQLAEATGGRAFYSRNLLTKAMETASQMEQHSYTLAYSPKPYQEDGSWHKVRLTVDGPYQVHYRTGYYALAAEPARVAASPGTPSSTVGLARRTEAPNAPDAPAAETESPMVFRASLKQDGGSGKRPQFTILYDIPAAELAFQTASDGTSHARYRVAVVAYNSNGDILNSAQQVIETHYTPAQMQIVNRVGSPTRQTIDVPRGADFLLLAVQELSTQRVGTVQLTTSSAKVASATH